MTIEEIENICEREFGFMLSFGEKHFMRRHLSFETQSELMEYIRTRNPLDCYVSVAFYGYPTDMAVWKGAELFLDFDSRENTRVAYADALTVYEVLLDDFGLEKLSLRFSGSKGYHLVVHDPEPRGLDSRGRDEIADYLVGKYSVETLDRAAVRDVKRLRRIAGTRNSKSGRLCRVMR